MSAELSPVRDRIDYKATTGSGALARRLLPKAVSPVSSLEANNAEVGWMDLGYGEELGRRQGNVFGPLITTPFAFFQSKQDID